MGNLINPHRFSPVDPDPLTYYADTSPTAIASTEQNAARAIEWAFNTSRSLTGVADNNGWAGAATFNTNQRFAYTRPNPGVPVFKMRNANYHNNGFGNTTGIKNVKIYISSNVADYNTTYGADTALTLMFDGVIPQHVGSDVDDLNVLTLLSSFYNGDYIIYDVADTYGASAMGTRQFDIG